MASRTISLEDGWDRVYSQGIKPFIALVESDADSSVNIQANVFVELYDVIFRMVVNPTKSLEMEVYDRYRDTIRQFCLEYAVPQLAEVENKTDMALCTCWARRWDRHKRFTRGMTQLHQYLDKYFTQKPAKSLSPEEAQSTTRRVAPLKMTSFRIFKELVYDKYRAPVASAIHNAIARERDNEMHEHDALQAAVQVFVDLGFLVDHVDVPIYKVDLEASLLDHARQHYARKASEWMASCSCPAYLRNAETMLAAESRRVAAYLYHRSLDPLCDVVHKELLSNVQPQLLAKSTGMVAMLQSDNTKALVRLFRVYSRHEEELEPVAAVFRRYVAAQGSQLVQQHKAAPNTSSSGTQHSLVRELVDIHSKFSSVLKQCFSNHFIFQKALKEAFEEFINAEDRVSLLLAQFVHDILKRGTKFKASTSEEMLDNVVFLYGYITNKDVFENFYQRALSSRLLMGQCESEYAEKSMIARLKTQAGYQWTNKLEGMFKDIQHSKDLMARFRHLFDSEKQLGASFHVNVCNKGVWPAGAHHRVRLPDELNLMCGRYREFYLREHTGRRLDWRLDLGSAEVKVLFSPKTRPRTLLVTPYQMAVLLIFNHTNVVSYAQILDHTGLPDKAIAHHLLSLAHPKVQVLNKKPNNKALAPDHVFRINSNFKSKLLRVQVPLLTSLVAADKQKEVNRAILLQRRHQMDASIVRIMKIRKTLTHAALVGEVISQLSARFRPVPQDVKRRIEALIDNEYLERHPEQRNVYFYNA